MSDIYDDPEIVTASNFVKFENVGDKVVGDVLAVTRGQDFNGKPAVVLIVRDDSGEEKAVTCGQAQLRVKISDPVNGRPRAGDRIAIVFTKTEKVDKGTLKHFDVQVKRGGAVGVTAAAESASSGVSASDLI